MHADMKNHHHGVPNGELLRMVELGNLNRLLFGTQTQNEVS